MHSKDSDFVVSYRTLRQMVGWIGILLPLGMRIGGRVFEGIPFTASISAYYYTGMRDVFVSTMVLVGALLACNRSPSTRDNFLWTCTGIAAMGIGLFPMEPVYADVILDKFKTTIDQCYMNTGIRGYHFIFVVVFFALAIYLVTFRFGATSMSLASKQKDRRLHTYRICGAVMTLASLWILYLTWRHESVSIFWPEAAAVVAFSFAWLVKGQVPPGFKDPAT